MNKFGPHWKRFVHHWSRLYAVRISANFLFGSDYLQNSSHSLTQSLIVPHGECIAQTNHAFASKGLSWEKMRCTTWMFVSSAQGCGAWWDLHPSSQPRLLFSHKAQRCKMVNKGLITFPCSALGNKQGLCESLTSRNQKYPSHCRMQPIKRQCEVDILSVIIKKRRQLPVILTQKIFS